MKEEKNQLVFASEMEFDPATIVAALKVGSYVATIAGLGVSWTSARKTKKQLEEILNFLRQIAQDLKEIKEQNKIIIEKLNELPNEIGIIVTEIIQINELKNRYNDLDAIQEMFEEKLKNNRRFYFKKDSIEFNEIYQSLKYLADYEFRIGFCLDIIRCCEMSVMVTNHDKAMRSYIKNNVISPKIEYLQKVYGKIKNNIDQKAQKMYDLITSSGQYIQRTNLNEILKIDDLLLEYNPDKATTKVIQRSNPHNDYEDTVKIPGAIEFNKQKTILSSEIEDNKKSLLELIKFREEVNSIGASYAIYSKGLDE